MCFVIIKAFDAGARLRPCAGHGEAPSRKNLKNAGYDAFYKNALPS
jgi:hypothetical protein